MIYLGYEGIPCACVLEDWRPLFVFKSFDGGVGALLRASRGDPDCILDVIDSKFSISFLSWSSAIRKFWQILMNISG